MNWLKNKLRLWLFPEIDKVDNFMTEIREAQMELRGKSITCKEPIILIGSLYECKVNIKSTIKPEIILSKFELEAALRIMGSCHMVTNSLFQTVETTVRLKDKQ